MDTFEEKVLEECRDCDNIFIFVSKEDEVNTHNIIRELLKQNKRVIVPVCDKTNKNIIPCRLERYEELARGSYGVAEPSKINQVQKYQIDLFLVPGTVFDAEGNRHGRGEGYFDRFLADIKGRKKIVGLCLKHQIKKGINPRSWDVAADKVIPK